MHGDWCCLAYWQFACNIHDKGSHTSVTRYFLCLMQINGRNWSDRKEMSLLRKAKFMAVYGVAKYRVLSPIEVLSGEG